jgi:hypothetical protein
VSEVIIIEVAEQGPPGPSGADFIFQCLAAEAIGGHRVVVGSGFNGVLHADANDEVHFGKVIGVTLNAASIGGAVSVKNVGTIDEPSWAFTPDVDIWLASNGLFTQTPPNTAFTQRIGYALTPTRIWVDLSDSIIS